MPQQTVSSGHRLIGRCFQQPGCGGQSAFEGHSGQRFPHRFCQSIRAKRATRTGEITRWERFGARASTSSKPSNCMGENLTSPLSIWDLSRILEVASRRKRNRRHRCVYDSLGVH